VLNDFTGYPALAWNGGAVLAVWSEQSRPVMARFVSRSGLPLGVPFCAPTR